MMIDKNKIKTGIGAGILVAALAVGGIAFSNGETRQVGIPVNMTPFEDMAENMPEIKDTPQIVQDEVDLKLMNRALTSIAPENAPIWLEPEIFEYSETQEAAKVPYGYSLYQYKNEVSGVLGVEIDEDTITFIGSPDKSLKGAYAVKNEYYKVMQLMDSFIKSYKEGTANKELYVEPEKSVNEDGLNELRIPSRYRIFYVGDDSSKQAGMLGVGYEKDGKRVQLIESSPDLVLWDTEVITVPADCSTEYVGLEPKLALAFKETQRVKREMEAYHNGLQQKAIN